MVKIKKEIKKEIKKGALPARETPAPNERLCSSAGIIYRRFGFVKGIFRFSEKKQVFVLNRQKNFEKGVDKSLFEV